MSSIDFDALINAELSRIDQRERILACVTFARAYRSMEIEGGVYKDLSSRVDIKQLMLYCRAELHELLCSNSKKYSKERAQFVRAGTGLVSFLAGLLVAKFGLALATATAVAVACLTLPFKMTVVAWCKMYRDNELSRHEQAILQNDQ